MEASALIPLISCVRAGDPVAQISHLTCMVVSER